MGRWIVACVLEQASARVLAQNHRGRDAEELVIGARAVPRHPHIQHYASPFSDDQKLGTVLDWPGVEALLLWDSFEPGDRPILWCRVDACAQPVWILLKRDQRLSSGSAGLTVPCAVAVPANVQC